MIFVLVFAGYGASIKGKRALIYFASAAIFYVCTSHIVGIQLGSLSSWYYDISIHASGSRTLKASGGLC